MHGELFGRSETPELRFEDIESGADEIAGKFSRFKRVVLAKTGINEEERLAQVFDALQERSLEGKYKTDWSGRSIRFFAVNLEAGDLFTLFGKYDYFSRLAEFVSREPKYVERIDQILGEMNPHRYAFSGAEDSDEQFEKLFKCDLVDRLREDRGIGIAEVRLVLKRFANPESWSYFNWDRGDVRVEEADPDYPILVPAFNVSFANQGDDPEKRLREFNRRFAKHGREGVSDEEIILAFGSHGVVNLVESLLYTRTGNIQSYCVVAVPSFPYELIEENYHGREEWMGRRGPNDDLYDLYKGVLAGEI